MSRTTWRPIVGIGAIASLAVVMAALAQQPAQQPATQPSAAPPEQGTATTADSAATPNTATPAAVVQAEVDVVEAPVIFGRVEAHDNKVLGIVVPADAAPAAGDSFEVFLTTPAGERSRVGRGKLSFAKNGVVLGRLDEATGELALGQEVQIRSTAAQPTKSAPVDMTKLAGQFVGDDAQFPFVLQVETRGDSTVVRGLGRMPYSAAEPTSILAEFVGISTDDDPQSFRGVLTLQPDGAVLKEAKYSPWVGLYDPAEEGWQLMFSPKHVVGASRPGAAAKHLNKPGAPPPPPPPANKEPIDVDGIFSNIDKLIKISEARPDDINGAAIAIRMDTDNHVAAAAAAAVRNQAQLGTRWNQTRTALANLSNRAATTGRPSPAKPPRSSADGKLPDQDARDYLNNMQLVLQGLANLLNSDVLRDQPPPSRGVDTGSPAPRNPQASGTPPTPIAAGGSASGGATPVTPVQPPIPPAPPSPPNMTLDEAVAFLNALGMSHDRISSVLVPAPDATRAGQVVRINRLPGGRIEIVNYGDAPDGPNVAPGGTTTDGGSQSNPPLIPPGNPPNSAGGTAATGGASSGAAGGGSGSGTPPGNGGAPPTPGATSLVNNDGSNRVPGSPPNMPPPSDPGAPPNTPPSMPPNTPPGGGTTLPPAPPAIPPSTPRPERIVRGAAGTGRGDGVYDPNITVLVNEDSGQAPTPALTQAQINAARAALNRNQVAGGVQSLAKGPDAAHHAASSSGAASSTGSLATGHTPPPSVSALTPAQINAAQAALAHAAAGGTRIQVPSGKPQGNAAVQHHAPAAAPAGPQGFQPGDGVKVHARYAAAVVNDGSMPEAAAAGIQMASAGSNSMLLYNGVKPSPSANQRGDSFMIRKFPTAAEAKSFYDRYVEVIRNFKEANLLDDDGEGHVTKLPLRSISATASVNYVTTHHQYNSGNTIDNNMLHEFVIYRDVFLISHYRYLMAEPATGEDLSTGHEQIITNAKKLIDLRFPQDYKQPHSLAGTWRHVNPPANFPPNYVREMTIKVNGDSIEIVDQVSSSNANTVPGAPAVVGTITGPNNGVYTAHMTRDGQPYTQTFPVSPDNSTITIMQADGTPFTWSRVK